jgi:hypothetical protein
MDLPTAQEKSEQIFFAQPKAHQNKFADLNKMVPTDPLRMIAFFEQCQVTNMAAGVLEKITKDKKQPKERKMAHLPAAHSGDRATIIIAVTSTAVTIKVTDTIVMITNLTIIIKRINAMIMVDTTTKMQRATSPTTRRMIASAITPRKKATMPCIMTTPFCQAPEICPEEGVDLVQDLLCALVLGLSLAQAAGATTTIMSTKMIASQAQPPCMGIHTPRTMMTDITIA